MPNERFIERNGACWVVLTNNTSGAIPLVRKPPPRILPTTWHCLRAGITKNKNNRNKIIIFR